MNKVLIYLGSNIRLAIMSDSTLVHYATYDYKNDSLSFIYSFLKELKIDKAVVCMPTTFSKEIMCESTALQHTKLAHISGYFCVSFTDLFKLEHLLTSLGISDIQITERQFFPHDGNVINVFESDGAFEVYVYKNGILVDSSVQIDSTLSTSLKQFCMKYEIKKICNYVNYADLEGLPNTFNNVFVLNDKRVLSDLTVMAALNSADTHSLNEYYESDLTNQEVVSQESKSETEAGTTAAHLADEPDVQPVVKNNKSAHKKSSFTVALAVITAFAICANGALHYTISQQKSDYLTKYAQYTNDMSTLSTLQSRYTMLSSENTSTTGATLKTVLNKLKLNNKNSKIKMTNLTVSGSTVTLIITAASDDAFQKFLDKLQKYTEVSSVSDGDETEDTKEYTITMIM